MPDVYSLINQPAFLKAKNKTKEICAKFISLTYVLLRYLLFYIKFILCLSLSCMVYVMFVTQMANLYISSKNHDNVT